MTIDKKTSMKKTTCSKWQKGNMRRIYLNSPVLRRHSVKIYFDSGINGYCVPHQIGKLADYDKTMVIEQFWQYLVGKGIADKDRLYLDFEIFDTFWNKL